MLNEWTNLALILMALTGMILTYYVGKSVGYEEAQRDRRKRKPIYDRNHLMR